MKKNILFLFVLFAFIQTNAQSIVIGTGTGTTAGSESDPVDGYFQAFRYQVVYTAAQLSASLTPYDQITALGFSIDEDYAGGNLMGYTIKMGNTTETNSAIHNVNATTVVKNAFAYNPTVTAAGVFNMIIFDTPFVWNGADNVVVEICSDGPNVFSATHGGVRTTPVINGSRRFRIDLTTACGVTTQTVNGNRPNIQFNYVNGVPPSCPAPTGLVANNVTSTSANIVWNAVAGSVNYEYVLNNTATNPVGSGTIITATTYAASLAPLTTYYFHLRGNCGAGGFSSWSTLSFITPATPPVNDNCSGATVLIPAVNFASGVQSGTILGATTTVGIAPSCQSSTANDVWYSVVVPASGTLTIETRAAASDSMTDSVLAAFSGTCGALIEVGCDDDAGIESMSLLSLTGQTQGATLRVGVWKFGTSDLSAINNQFQIAAYDASLGSDSFDNANFSYYPNPVKNRLNLSYDQNISDVTIYNLLGQQMMVKVINDNQSQIEMSHFSSGTYLVKITAESQVKMLKVVKE
ncbi:T9SS type A sorting domain-containing protein [Flavobacterium sp.]|uniref:T9SS type A sorting domain-containing protein n=1 Tax=Flavobacterium sp. TaxID=239 RepID=UPI002B4AD8F4|nr:T9SS type A sorting domain-containing protein [Flavobacterium sp.]HLF52241.1 T9SS type A sorting domain-containing protein [Flavobacterium sp.]